MKSTRPSSLWYWGALGYLAFPPAALYYGVRMMVSTKYRRGLRQRLTVYRPDELAALRQGRFIWVHTVSVGELQAARSLLRRLREEFPEHRLLVTTVTETGQNLARSLPEVDQALYLPLDLYALCRRVLRLVQPVGVIVLETEIWPNFIRAVSRLNLPLFLVNARLSDRSYRNYYRTRRLFAPLLNRFTAILAQSPRDRERFAALGVDDARLQQTGNLKFDSVAVQPGVEERRHWRHFLRLEADDLLLVAGSTFAGEEILLARIVRDLRQSGIPLRLLIAPRHIERVPAIQDELSAAGFSTVRRSAWEGAAAPGNAVMLLDTIGELRQVYAAADAVFIGKSLTEQGGQNPIEPAAWGKPVLFGPNMQNFRDVAALLLEAGGARQVGDETELQEAVLRLCQSPAERQAMGQAGQAVVRANQGALQQIMNAIQPVLQAPQAPA